MFLLRFLPKVTPFLDSRTNALAGFMSNINSAIIFWWEPPWWTLVSAHLHKKRTMALSQLTIPCWEWALLFRQKCHFWLAWSISCQTLIRKSCQTYLSVERLPICCLKRQKVPSSMERQPPTSMTLKEHKVISIYVMCCPGHCQACLLLMCKVLMHPLMI